MLATKVIGRVLLAAALFALAATVIVVDLSENYDCSNREGIMELGVASGAALAGLGSLALTWTRRWRWLYAIAAFVLTFLAATFQEFAMAIGKCAN